MWRQDPAATMKMHWGFWFIFCLHWRVVSFFCLYFCSDEPQNLSKRVRLFSIYRERKEKLGNKSKLPSLFFNLKVVLELFHLLFCSSEVLLLLIPSPSGEALMKKWKPACISLYAYYWAFFLSSPFLLLPLLLSSFILILISVL